MNNLCYFKNIEIITPIDKSIINKVFAERAMFLAEISTAILFEDPSSSHKTSFTAKEIITSMTLGALLAGAKSKSITTETKHRVIEYLHGIGIEKPETTSIESISDQVSSHHMIAFTHFLRALDAAQVA